MTENEVFEGIHKDCGKLEICDYKKTGCGDCLIRQTLIKAEKALEEIQAYRAIGTVEEITNLINFLRFDDDTSILEDLRMLVNYYAIGTVEEFKALKENQRECKDCAGCTTWKCDCANERDKAVDDFANFVHEKAKENNGLRLSSETRSWTHPSIFDYVKEFKNEQICNEEA